MLGCKQFRKAIIRFVSNFVEKFCIHCVRTGATGVLQRYRNAIQVAGLANKGTERRMARMMTWLVKDRMTVVFIAEFLRRNAKVITAILFSNYSERILPSSVGRTTMFSTALMHDASLPPAIRLLPIETCISSQSTNDLRAASRQVSLARNVFMKQVQAYGLYDPDNAKRGMTVGVHGLVEISRWRHAIVNFPHPLPKEGMVINDTPGLNAMGSEPELTLNLIPNAHAVFCILPGDTGVRCTDIEVRHEPTGVKKFFESIACRIKHILVLANRNAEARLKKVMAPLEAQLCEHKDQPKQRRHSIARIHLAADGLKVRIGALERMQYALVIYRQALAS